MERELYKDATLEGGIVCVTIIGTVLMLTQCVENLDTVLEQVGIVLADSSVTNDCLYRISSI